MKSKIIFCIVLAATLVAIFSCDRKGVPYFAPAQDPTHTSIGCRKAVIWFKYYYSQGKVVLNEAGTITF